MLSIPHLMVIFVVALIIFGPEKLPELARNLGKVMAEFRRATGDLQSTFEGHLRDIEREADATRVAAANPVKDVVLPPSPLGDASVAALAGTTPSNAPNASAIAAGNAAASSASGVYTSGEVPGSEPVESASQTEAAPPEGSSEPAQVPEHGLDHVSDGGSGQS